MADLIDRALHLESLVILVRIRDRDAFAPLVARHVDPAATWPAEPMSGTSPLVQELSDGAAALVRDHVGARSTAPTRVSCSRTSAPGVPRRRCPSGTAG